MSDRMETVEVPMFIKKKHELASLLKQVERGSQDAVELIMATMNADDKEVPREVRLKCAYKLVELQIDLSKEISKDQITRQIAEIKVKGLSTNLELQPGEKRRLPPKIEFNMIQEVG